jgi:Zn-dependent protease with chaperone function
MAQMPFINAMAVGADRPMVVLHSQTVNVLEEQELRTVLGHEAAHILSEHVKYTTALMILLRIGVGPLMRLPFFAGLPLLAVELALLEWFRAAELSCDRAATLVNRSPMTTCQTLMVVAGGAASRKLSLDAFVRQAAEYEETEPGFDKLTRFRTELFQTHPFPVRRVSELMKWVRSGEYDRVVSGEYRRRGDANQPRNDAGDAAEFYAERFRNLFREVGEGVNKAGDKVSDAADRLAGWIRSGGTS